MWFKLNSWAMNASKMQTVTTNAAACSNNSLPMVFASKSQTSVDAKIESIH